MNTNRLLQLASALALAACVTTPEIPSALQPEAKETLAMVVPAKGVQIYECRAKKDNADAFEWAFVGPQAELYDMRGNLIGTHGAGPSWQALDGSRIVGSVKARADAPTAGNIPWLLLATTNAGPSGSFSRVTSVQRVNTWGGLPPAKPCNREFMGKQVGIHYAADYRFYVSTTNTKG